MTDLEQQLRTYVESAFAEVPPTSAGDVTGAGAPPALAVVFGDKADEAPPVAPGRRRRWAVGVAAAVVVALVVTLVVARDGDGPESRVATGDRLAPVTTDTDPVPSASGEWTVDLGGEIPYAPVVVDGAVVVVSMVPGSDLAAATVIALEERGWEQGETVASRRWSVDLGAPVVTQPVVAENLVLLRLAADRLIAVGADDGIVRWSAPTGAADRSPPPVVSGGAVFVGSIDGTLESFDLDDGSLRWKRSVGDGVVAPPTFVNGRLYVGTAPLPVDEAKSGQLLVFNRDGMRLRSFTTRGPVLTSPAAGRGVAATTSTYWGTAPDDTTRGAVEIVTSNLGPGETPYSHRFSGDLSAPFVFGDLVVIGWKDQLIAYPADASASPAWTASIGANQATEVLRRGPDLIATGGDSLVALERETGHQRWRAPVSDAFFGQSDDSDRIVAVSRRGSLAVVDVSDGSLLVDFALHDTPAGAVLHDGTLVWTGTGGVVTTARLDAAQLDATRPCAASNVEPKGPDGMPNRDSVVDETAALVAAERNLDVLERRFGPVLGVSTRAADMKAWVRDSAGAITVEDVRGYEIVVQLARSADCPDAPFFLEGYPTRFYVPER